jgi:hypothetical protein
MFYKDGQKEEMACQGARVAAALVKRGRISVKQLGLCVKDYAFYLKYKDTLTRYVCRQCPFMKDDCDFQSSSPSHDLEPCGGYVVLAALIEDRLIDSRDLDNRK